MPPGQAWEKQYSLIHSDCHSVHKLCWDHIDGTEFPSQGTRQKCMPYKKATAGNIIQWTMQFKQKQIIGLQSPEYLFAAWLPEI